MCFFFFKYDGLMIHVLRGSLGCVVDWWKVEAAAIVKLAMVTPPGQNLINLRLRSKIHNYHIIQ